ncbi:hypothetical protein VaNZ11_008325 [Volvox africanus]|uniref:Uncharacterized protein n=1 Tax=Volvox africanus TaxID=51714 RepID=A0ABQ5S6F4_9CHLO|nr:hypothetical protein VaNZ11_008325 [Volvox africanus]
MADPVLAHGPIDTAGEECLSPSTSTCTSAQPPMLIRPDESPFLPTCNPCTFHGYPDNLAAADGNDNIYLHKGGCGVNRSITYEVKIPIPVSCGISGEPLPPVAGMGGDMCGGNTGGGRQRTLKLYTLSSLKPSPSISVDLRGDDSDGLGSPLSCRFPWQGQPSQSARKLPQWQQHQQHLGQLHFAPQSPGCVSSRTAWGDPSGCDTSDLPRGRTGEPVGCVCVPSSACHLTTTAQPNIVDLRRPSTSFKSPAWGGYPSGPPIVPPLSVLHRVMQQTHQRAVKDEDVVCRDGNTKEGAEAMPVPCLWPSEHEGLCPTHADRGCLGQPRIIAAAGGTPQPQWSEMHTAEPDVRRTYGGSSADSRKRQWPQEQLQLPEEYTDLRLPGTFGLGLQMIHPLVSEQGAGALWEAAPQAIAVRDSAAETNVAIRANSQCHRVHAVPEAVMVMPSRWLLRPGLVPPAVDQDRAGVKICHGWAEDMDHSNADVVRTCLAVPRINGNWKELPAPAAAVARGSASGGGGFVGSEGAARGGGVAASGDLCTGDTTPSSTSTLPSPPPVGPSYPDQQQHDDQHGCAKRVCEVRGVQRLWTLRLYPLAARAMPPPAPPHLSPPVKVSARICHHFDDGHVLAAPGGTQPIHNWASTAVAPNPAAAASMGAATGTPREVPEVVLVRAMGSSSRGGSATVSSEESAGGAMEAINHLRGVRQDETFRLPLLGSISPPLMGPPTDPPQGEGTASPAVGLRPAMPPLHPQAPAARTARLKPDADTALQRDLAPSSEARFNELPKAGIQGIVCRGRVWCRERCQCGNISPQRCRGEELEVERCGAEVIDLTANVTEDENEDEKEDGRHHGKDGGNGRVVVRQSALSPREYMYVLPEGHGMSLVVLGGTCRKRKRSGARGVGGDKGESDVGDRNGPAAGGGTLHVRPVQKKRPHIEQAEIELAGTEDQQGEEERQEQKQGHKVSQSRCGWPWGRRGGPRKLLRGRGAHPRNSVQ